MNFFDRQERARRNSRLLLGIFLLGTVLVVLALDVAASVIWYFMQMFIDRPLQGPPKWLHIGVIGTASATILFMSARKTLEVYRGGGLAVARMMDARQVVPVNASPLERRLLNIVDEMAIASGTRVPVVFVMDQIGGINAFAAGFDGKLCAIVVTWGALQNLNRTELQGVIGHEFSHIVNGDMAFNLQMIGVLSGLMFIGGAGAYLLRTMPQLSRTDFRAAFLTFLVGASLFVIGYFGLLAGQLIKAKIAREREYGADAGSVQFTRNPEALAGALDQLRRHHSTVLHLHAEDVSHLFFGEAIYLEEERWLSTHPPLDERIGKLAPDFTPARYRDQRVDPLVELERSMKPPADPFGNARPPATAADLVALVGSFGERDVQAAAVLLASLPAAARTALQTRDGAAALAIALVTSSRDADAEGELSALRAGGFETLAASAAKLVPVTRTLPATLHLPAADLALGELARQPADYRGDVIRALGVVIDADREVSAYRYACLTLMRSQLAPGARKPGHQPLAALQDDVVLLLSLIAHAGGKDAAGAEKAFAAGMKEMELAPAKAAPRESCDAPSLTAALDRLRDLAPLPKARVIRGAFSTITADAAIDPVEAALLRMLGAVLDCPIPPM